MFVDYSLRWKCLVSENRFERYAFGTAGAEYSAAYNQRQEDLIRPCDLVDSAVRRIALSVKAGIGDSALRNGVLPTRARFLLQRYPAPSRERSSELQLH
jgi:hypothetical protein